MRPVFVGNFDFDTRQSDLERLFSRYGRVDRADMKNGATHGNRALYHGLPFQPKPSMPLPPASTPPSIHNGFAFIYFDDERDAEDAIRGLDGTPFGYNKRRISVEWARQGERGRHHGSSRAMTNTKPTKTLFVINFDPVHTRIRDIERHFEPYGKVLHVRIRRNFAFVQFETQEEATKALECTHMSKILDRVVSVEYALRDDGDRGRDSPRRGGGGGGSYGRRDSPGYGRSPSPVRRRAPVRPSPDYGRARSPVYDRYNVPVYERNRSPDYGRYPSRSPIRRSRS